MLVVGAGQSQYNLTNSLRFRSSASAYLSRTPASAGNRQIYTWSGWVKRGALTTSGNFSLFGAGTTSPDYDGLRFSSDSLQFFQGGAVSVSLVSTPVYRDPSAWYHIVLAVDTTQATAANRVKIYVNGSQITAFSTANYPALNASAAINNTYVHTVAAGWVTSVQTVFDGYLAEVNFIDGQALTPSSFGATNATTGVWQPKKYTGTYGTNGFYLKFSDIATTSGSNAGLGKDFSGNTNYWNTNNISVTAGTTYDAMSDVPTLTSATVANYAVMNPLDMGSNITISDGNLKFVSSSSAGVGTCRASMAFPTTGKWYFEVTAGSTAFANTVGIANSSMNVTTGLGDNANGWGYSNDGYVYNNGAGTNTSTTWGNGDIAGIAFDADSGKLWFAKNNTWVLSGNPSSGTNPAFTGLTGATFFPAVSDYGGGSTANLVANFGQRPFAYTPPTGFNRLCTFNLPTPTILQGNKYMDATTYTGTGAVQSVTNAGTFKPDFLWIKCRSTINNNSNFDSTRGVLSELFSNLTNAQYTTADGFTAFNSNGFSLDNSGSGGNVNVSGRTYVAWQWNANNGTTSSNTSGSITSTVSVNTTAGFSVVTYTAQTSGNATVGHGLGVAPKMIITKCRSTANDWIIWHTALTSTEYILLNTTAAKATGAAIFWNSTLPTSTVFSLGSAFAAASDTYVAYCWAEIAGYSKFGSYTGNASTDGPFVYLGFRPKFIMVKSSSAVGNWFVIDSMRDLSNVATRRLFPNLSNAEDTSALVDFTANGFKLRMSSALNDASTYIYMAFAENPFKNALAR